MIHFPTNPPSRIDLFKANRRCICPAIHLTIPGSLQRTGAIHPVHSTSLVVSQLRTLSHHNSTTHHCIVLVGHLCCARSTCQSLQVWNECHIRVVTSASFVSRYLFNFWRTRLYNVISRRLSMLEPFTGVMRLHTVKDLENMLASLAP